MVRQNEVVATAMSEEYEVARGRIDGLPEKFTLGDSLNYGL